MALSERFTRSTGGAGAGGTVPLATFTRLGQTRQTYVNVFDWGAKGDAVILTDAAMTATSANLLSAGAVFTSDDIGKIIEVQGAGAAGVNLFTTIASITNSTTAVLTVAAGTTVSGAQAAYGHDDRPAFQAAVDSLGTDTGVVFAPATHAYLFGSLASGYALKLPRNVTGRLQLSGYGATIVLTTGCPRFCDLGVVATNDTFQNIVLSGFRVDANYVGGPHHIILGSYRNRVQQSYYNIDGLIIEDIVGVNALTDATKDGQGRLINHRLWVFVVPAWDTPGAGNHLQGTVQHVRVRRCDAYGGNIGFVVAATRTASADTDTSNCFIDDVVFEDCRHFSVDVGSNPNGASNFQIGSNGFGGRAKIIRCYGEHSGDVGIETDALTEMTIEDTEIRDAYSACFYHTNINTPLSPNDQVTRYINCTARRLTLTAYPGDPGTGAHAYYAMGWYVFDLAGKYNSVRPNRVIIDGCKWYRGAATTDMFLGTLSLDSNAYGEAISITNTAEVIIRDTITTTEGVNYSGSDNVTPSQMCIGSVAPNLTNVVIRNLHSHYIDCTRSGTGIVQLNPWKIGGVSGSTGALINLDIDGLYCDFDFNGLTSTAYRGLGLGAGKCTVNQATIAHVAVRSFYAGASGTGQGMEFQDDSSLVIARRLIIRDCDLRLMGSTPINFRVDSGASNGVHAYIDGLNEPNNPPVIISVTVTTGTFTYQNVLGYKMLAIVSGGTVSSIDYGHNFASGQNYYSTGHTSGQFLILPGDWLRILNTVAPTMTIVKAY